jgi:hypothetical protein
LLETDGRPGLLRFVLLVYHVISGWAIKHSSPMNMGFSTWICPAIVVLDRNQKRHVIHPYIDVSHKSQRSIMLG